MWWVVVLDLLLLSIQDSWTAYSCSRFEYFAWSSYKNMYLDIIALFSSLVVFLGFGWYLETVDVCIVSASVIQLFGVIHYLLGLECFSCFHYLVDLEWIVVVIGALQEDYGCCVGGGYRFFFRGFIGLLSLLQFWNKRCCLISQKDDH